MPIHSVTKLASAESNNTRKITTLKVIQITGALSECVTLVIGVAGLSNLFHIHGINILFFVHQVLFIFSFDLYASISFTLVHYYIVTVVATQILII